MGSTVHSYEVRCGLAFPPLIRLEHFENATAATIIHYKLPQIKFSIFGKSHDIILQNAPLQMSLEIVPRNSCKTPLSAHENISISSKNP